MSQIRRTYRVPALVWPVAPGWRWPGSITAGRSRASSRVYSLVRKDFDGGLVILERSADLDTLNHALDAFEYLLCDSNAFGASSLGTIDVPKPIEDGLRNCASRNFVVEEFRGFVTGEGQDPGNHRNLAIFDAFEEAFEN